MYNDLSLVTTHELLTELDRRMDVFFFAGGAIHYEEGDNKRVAATHCYKGDGGGLMEALVMQALGECPDH